MLWPPVTHYGQSGLQTSYSDHLDDITEMKGAANHPASYGKMLGGMSSIGWVTLQLSYESH